MASRTLVWLGPDEDGQGLAGTVLEKLTALMRDPDYKVGSHLNDLRIRECWSSLSHAERAAYTNFCILPYWSRQWIVQEVVLSPTFTLLYGNDTIDYETLEGLHTTAALDRGIDHSPMKALISILRNMRDYAKNVHAWFLTMEYTSQSKCQDARDKVYGIQYILPTELCIPIDYSLSTRSVFLAAAKRYFQHSEICVPIERSGGPDVRPKIGKYGVLQGIAQLAIGMGIAKEGGTVDIAFRMLSRAYIETRYGRNEGRLDTRIKWEELENLMETHLFR